MQKKLSLGAILAILGGLFVVILIFIGVVSSGDNSPSPVSDGAQQTPTAAPGPCDNFNDSAATSSISYAELSKDPSIYNGTDAVYTGEVVQIQQAPDGTGIIRLAVTKEDYGWDPNSIIYVTYSGGTNAVDNDVVKIYGQMSGEETYTSQANYQITVPSMSACEINDETQTPVPTPTTSVQSQVTPPAPSTQPAPAPSGTWHTAYTYSGGDNNVTTPPFTLQGSQWKVTYSCQLDTNGGYGGSGNFSGYVESTSDGSMISLFANGTCPASNTSYSYGQTPGTYALNLESLGTSYTVTVEDYY